VPVIKQVPVMGMGDCFGPGSL